MDSSIGLGELGPRLQSDAELDQKGKEMALCTFATLEHQSLPFRGGRGDYVDEED
jgi:hypothetical protein